MDLAMRDQTIKTLARGEKICGLCGVGMGKEPGPFHRLCALDESFREQTTPTQSEDHE